MATDSNSPHKYVNTTPDDRHVAQILESMATAFFALDREWRFSYVNAEAERVLSSSREQLLGQTIWERFPAAVDSPFEQHYTACMETGEPVAFEAFYPPPLNSWYEVRASASPDGISVYFHDITTRRLAEQSAERSAKRLALLTDVSTALRSTLDAERSVAQLAALLTKDIADWCIFTLADNNDRLHDIGRSHADPAMQEHLERYADLRLTSLTNESFLHQTLQNGEPSIIGSSATEAVLNVLNNDEAKDLLRGLAPESAVVIPLHARDRTVGVITAFRGADRPAIEPDDLATLIEIGARSALALDNMQLFVNQQRLSGELQRSLLTDPPEPDHLQIAVRYLPAADVAQVGGDWYDSFLQRDGATVLVIGDVIGHDSAAAAAMGQLRGLLRGIAYNSSGTPAEVLRGLDQAMEGLQVNTTATALVARLEQSDDELERGLTRLRWSNAGHPPAVVVHADGTFLELVNSDPDLLLGIDPRSERVDSEAVLDRGATVLLYTDGLIERHDQGFEEGIRELRSVLTEVNELSLEDLCDAVLDRMLPQAPEDDVALIAVRLHRQDQPRPMSAGPNNVPPNVS